MVNARIGHDTYQPASTGGGDVRKPDRIERSVLTAMSLGDRIVSVPTPQGTAMVLSDGVRSIPVPARKVRKLANAGSIAFDGHVARITARGLEMIGATS